MELTKKVRFPLMALALLAPLMLSADEVGDNVSSRSEVDVMLLFTQGMLDTYGTEGGVKTHLLNLIELGNTALSDSGVQVTWRLVHTQKVDYPDWQDGKTDRKQSLCHLTYGARELADVHTLRAAHQADLVVLVRRHDFPLDMSCGIAWIAGEHHGNVSASRDAPYGYAVVTDGFAWVNGVVMQCPEWTLAHELGHAFGAYHVGSEGRELAHSFAHAFVNSGNFKTIMATLAEDEPTVLRFSNPTRFDCPGARQCGVEGVADNARVLNTTREALSNFSESMSRAKKPDGNYPERFIEKCRQNLPSNQ